VSNLVLELECAVMSYLRSHEVTILHGPEPLELLFRSRSVLPGHRVRGDQQYWFSLSGKRVRQRLP